MMTTCNPRSVVPSTGIHQSSQDDEDDNLTELAILGEIVCGRLSRRVAWSTAITEWHVSCSVQWGSTHIHRTQSVSSRSPLWSLHNRSLFVFSTTLEELAVQKLQIVMMHKQKDPLKLAVLDTIVLGTVEMDGTTLLQHCDETQFTVPIQMDRITGYLTLRLRLATPADHAFVAWNYQDQPNKLLKKLGINSTLNVLRAIQGLQQHSSVKLCHHPGVQNKKYHHHHYDRPLAQLVSEEDEAQLAGATFVSAISAAIHSKWFFDDDEPRVRVKPCPDPNRVEQTYYLTANELKRLTLEPSHHWVDAGSGTLGKLYLEVLACHDLPNVDVGEAVGNVSDCFVCGVFEDVMVQTSVIHDELSPRWLPWTQRAFRIGILHPASVLYLGVFDFDLGLGDHEPIGRVAISISNFQCDTDYKLRYHLYKSSNGMDRTPSGCISIRLRVEYSDEKQAILVALTPRPKFHVNVRREKSLSVVRYTCFGENGDDTEQNFDLKATRAYINELLEYRSVLRQCCGDAMWSLVFWQGQVQFFNIYLPVHSFLLFSMCAILLDRPHLAPSFVLLSVAWILIATQTLRRQHPSPWSRCHSFRHYAEILATGKSSIATKNIAQNEGKAKADVYEKEWRERIAKDQKVAETRAALVREMNLIGDENIHTRVDAGIPLDLFVRLTRYQSILAKICRCFRRIKLVLCWEESIVSFWITASFLGGGLLSLLLPWRFLLYWTGHIVVYGLLGPHMMFVGLLLKAQSQDHQVHVERMVDSFRKQSHSARLRRQEALKLRDIKKLWFGKYSTLVPSVNLSRHYDRPLSSSEACYNGTTMDSMCVATRYIPGQQFFGGIIPRNRVSNEQFKAEKTRNQMRVDAIKKELDELNNKYSPSHLKEVIEEDEQDLPHEIGYETIPLARKDIHDDRETVVSMGEDSSLVVNEMSRIAVLSEGGQGVCAKKSTRSFPCEVITVKTACDHFAKVLLKSNEPDAREIVILETQGSPRDRFKRRRSSRSIVRLDALDSLVKANDKSQNTFASEAGPFDEGFEVVLELPDTRDDCNTLSYRLPSKNDA